MKLRQYQSDIVEKGTEVLKKHGSMSAYQAESFLHQLALGRQSAGTERLSKAGVISSVELLLHGGREC